MKPRPDPETRDRAERSRPIGGRAGGGRLTRTIALATVATVFGVYWFAEELNLDRDEILGLGATGLLLIGVAIVLGVVLGTLVWLIRRAVARRGD